MDLIEFKKIQSEYFQLLYKVTRNNVSLLADKLENIDDSYIILRALSSENYFNIKSEIESLFEKIVYLSIDGNPTQILWSRKIIKDIDREYLYENLESIIDKILRCDIDNENKAFIYRSITDLYYQLGFERELKIFLENHCKNSLDIDIREMYEDYL